MAIIGIGFQNSKANSPLFIYSQDSIICYILGNVDDLVVTCSDLHLVSTIIDKLGTRFSLKDMNQLHLFLGIEVIPTTFGIFLSQHKYIRDFLLKTNMGGAKDVSTPLLTSTILKLIDGTSSSDNTEFQSVIVGFQYLSLTRLDHLFIC